MLHLYIGRYPMPNTETLESGKTSNNLNLTQPSSQETNPPMLQNRPLVNAEGSSNVNPNIYPKIKIQIERPANLNSVIIKIVNQLSKDAAEDEVIALHTLAVAEGCFQRDNTAENKNVILKNHTIQPNAIHYTLQLPGITGGDTNPFKIAILPNGSCVCGDVSTGVALNIQTPAEIITTGVIKSKQLSLNADYVLTQSSITAEHIEVVAKTEFCNTGVIQSKDFYLYSKGKFQNHHTLRVEHLEIQGIRNENGLEQFPHIINLGLIHGNHTRINAKLLENSGHFLSDHCEAMLGREHKTGAFALKNNGIIFARSQLSFDVRGRALNEAQGQMISQKSLILTGKMHFKNYGEISSPKLELHSHYKLKNAASGVLNSRQLRMSTIQRGIENLGLISTEVCHLLMAQSFYNKGKIIVAGKLKVPPVGDALNEGLIVAGKGVKIRSYDAEKHTAESRTRSAGPIVLKTLGLRDIAGKVRAEDNITMTSGDDTLIQAKARVKTKKKFFINAFKNIQNLGVITGQEGYLKAIESIRNAEGGELRSTGPLSMVGKILKNAGQIHAGTHLSAEMSVVIEQLSSGRLESLKTLSLAVQGKLSNAGRIEALEKVSVFARDAIRNSGIILGKEINLQSQCLLDNLLTGIIVAGDHLNLFAKECLENAGTLRSMGSLKIDVNTILKNLKEGKIIAHKELKLLAGHVLSNIGKVQGDSKVSLESAHWLYNALGGEISGLETLSLKAYRLDNYGTLEARGKLYAEVLSILHNHSNGVFQAKGPNATLELVSKWTLDNDGLLFSEKTLKADVTLILDNHRNGLISAEEAILLVNASLVQNSGHIKGQQNVSLHAKSILNNLQEGNIQAKETLDLLANFAFENAGVLSAEHLHTEASRLLENRLQGVIAAGKEIKLTTEQGFLTNRGNVGNDDTERLKIQAQHIHNFSTGKLTAKETMDIIAKGHFEQSGSIKAKKVIIEALTLRNTGEIVSLSTVSLNVKHIFEHCEAGKITANDAVDLLSKNLLLMGQMMVQGNLEITVDERFDYTPESLWAAGLLRLMLKKGYDFTKPLNTPGGLHVETPAHLLLHHTLKSGKDATFKAQSMAIEKDGSIFAGGALFAEISDLLRIGQPIKQASGALKSDNAYVASEGNLHLKAGLIQNALGQIYSNSDLVLEALNRIENRGHVTAGGNAKIITPLFEHKLYSYSHQFGADALSETPTLTVSKNLDINGKTEVLGGHIYAAENLSYQGDFLANSFEAFRAWFDIHMVKGKRKGLGRGHHYETQYIPRHQALGIYDSHVSAGKSITGQGQRFTNCGAFRTEHLNIRFKDFYNGNSIVSSRKFSHDDNLVDLPRFFQTNALFGKVEKTGKTVYGAKLPFSFNVQLEPMVRLQSKDETINLLAHPLYEGIAEKDMVQRALQQILRSGYIDSTATSPEAILKQLRHNAYAFSSSTPQVQNAAPSSAPAVREQDLALSQKAMLFYRQKLHDGELVLSPQLFMPSSDRALVGLGDAAQAVMRAKDAKLVGEANSLAVNTGKVQSDRLLDVNADKIVTQQRTSTQYQQLTINRKQGTRFVATQQGMSETGEWLGEAVRMKAQQYHQIGGYVYSGMGGTELIIRDESFIQALRTTQAVQGEISRKGRNYQIEPVFLPARLISKGNQTIIVTQGPFTAEGMYAYADKKMIVEAQKKLTIRNIRETLDLATTENRSGFAKSKRSKTGGTSFSSLSSYIHGGEGLKLVSHEDSIQVIASLLSSGGDAEIQAKKIIEILNDTAQTTFYHQGSKFKGFSYQHQSVKGKTDHTLASQVLIDGNLTMKAIDEVHLKALQGLITKNMSIEALNVIIEGAVEKNSITTKTKSLGVSFFGSNVMESVFNGENGRKALSALMDNDSFTAAIKELSNSKEKGEKLTQFVQTFVEGWRLAALVAHACKETKLDGEKNGIIGSLTDRCGLTTPITNKQGKIIGHKFNPSFKFTYTQSKTVRETTRVIPTTLMIGGDLHIVADIIKILDGAQIEAENITLHARRLLEIKAGKETQRMSSSQQQVSASFKLNGSFDGASVNVATHKSESVQYRNAVLKARGLFSILSDGKTHLSGAQLKARDIVLRTVELLQESLQDTHQESGYSFGVSVGGDGKPSSVQASTHKAESRWTHNPSQIHATHTLDLFVDHIIQNGAILSAGERLRVRGLHQQHPISWDATELHDSAHGRSAGVKLGLSKEKDSFPCTGFMNYKSSNKTGVTRPTVSALDLAAPTAPSNINRDLSRVQEVISNKESGIWIPIVVPNVEQMKKDTEAFSDLFDHRPNPIEQKNESEKLQAEQRKRASRARKKIMKRKMAAKKSKDINTKKPNKDLVTQQPPEEQSPVMQEASKEIEVAADWLDLAWRSFKGEQSEEVTAWRKKNREAAPLLAAIGDELGSSKDVRIGKAFLSGVKESVKETAEFIGEEVARLHLGEQTKTGAAIESVATFVGKEAARVALLKQTQTERFILEINKFTRNEITRLNLGVPTKTEVTIVRGFEKLSQMSGEDVAKYSGNFVGGMLTGYGIGQGGSLLNKGTKFAANVVEQIAYDRGIPILRQYDKVLYSAKGSKGWKNVRNSDAGRKMPERLTIREIEKVREWEKVYNQFMGKYFDVTKEIEHFNPVTRELLSRKAVNRIKDQLDPETLSARLKELRGIKIYSKDGKKVMDHLGKMRESGEASKKLIGQINSQITKFEKYSRAKPGEIEFLKQFSNDLQSTIDNAYKLGDISCQPEQMMRCRN